MEFVKNAEYAEAIGEKYGEYVCTFHSDHQQATAEIFRKNGSLLAYVSFRDDLATADIKDDYYTPLHAKAEELGFKDKLKIIYSGR